MVVDTNFTQPTADAGNDAIIDCLNSSLIIGPNPPPTGVSFNWTTLDGVLTLVDAETDAELKVTVDPALREIYRSRLDARLHHIESYCRKVGIDYLRASTVIPFEDVVLKYLRQGTVWR